MIRLVRSSAFRVALAFACGLTLTTYVVFAIVDWQFYRWNVALVRSVLEDEAVKALAESSQQLQTRLDLRLTQDLRHLDYVGLYNRDGSLTFGNGAATLPVPPDGRAHFVRAPPPQPEPWQSENAIFVAHRRPDGGVLLLGRSLVYVEQLEATMGRVFAETIVPVTFVALLVGALVSVRASRRLTRIQDAITRVMAGNLLVRLPSRGSPDDIDELCRAVNLMLDEIGRLVGQIRSVGDNIAHDLRAPLAVMRARLERGLAGSSEETLRTLTVEALGDLERAMTTVTALLRISNLESGIRRGAFARVDLAAVCREACELFQPLAEAKGAALDLSIHAQLFVSGDTDLLREALANLIDNAIKFTPAGGRVRVETGGPGFLFRVSDTGPGVLPEERAKIVKRFYRSEATCETPGVGLGLSMTATIVDLHGFRLEIGAADPGATFTVLEKAQAAGREVGTAAPASRGQERAQIVETLAEQ